MGYYTRLIDKLKVVEDAITGNKLNLLEQTIYITTDAGQNATGSGISGVQRSDYANVKTMPELSDLLVMPSPLRSRGTHPEQDVIFRAEPGSGKTWSLQQLVLLLAYTLFESKEPVPLVPILVPVQRLAVLMRDASPAEREGDLLLFFIEKNFSGDEKKMLLQVRSGSVKMAETYCMPEPEPSPCSARTCRHTAFGRSSLASMALTREPTSRR